MWKREAGDESEAWSLNKRNDPESKLDEHKMSFWVFKVLKSVKMEVKGESVSASKSLKQNGSVQTGIIERSNQLDARTLRPTEQGASRCFARL